MCGVLCTINVDFNSKDLGILNHRGPNTNGLVHTTYSGNSLTFGHTRLAIQDLGQAANQPFISPCGNYILIFNGEIYNHLEIRRKLPDIQFQSHSDSETLFHFLIQNENQGLHLLNGIFSFCFYNKLKGRITIARDPIGVKPLYYYHQNNLLVVSSEIKAIQRLVPISIDKYRWYASLKLRYSLAPTTIYHEVSKVKPGYLIDIDLSKDLLQLDQCKFYHFDSNAKFADEEELIHRYDLLLQQAVERQLLSDVPLSLLLSGGIDSALLLHYIKQCTDKPIEAFTIGYNESHQENEIHHAHETARFFGLKTNTIQLTEQAFAGTYDQLPVIVEEPVASQSLVPFMVLMARLKEDSFRVALSGQGVDELLGGYNRYKYQNLLGSCQIDLRGFSRLLPSDKLRRGLESLSASTKAELYLASYSFFTDDFLDRLIPYDITGFKEQLLDDIASKIDSCVEPLASSAQTMMSLDLHTALNDDLLNYTDKISMHNSIEVRVPYLDLELVQFLKSVPANLKVHNRKGKILHKMLCQKVLPPHFIHRKKKGFFVPRNRWFKGELNTQFRSIISQSNSSEVLNANVIDEVLVKHLKPNQNLEDQVFFLMNLFFLLERDTQNIKV